MNKSRQMIGARHKAKAARSRVTKSPRLVVTTSNFQGQEFLLRRAVATIGRGIDNDLVVHHRSVSRHHARLTMESNGEYAIRDLMSTNGVRVNGRQYGAVELRRGDLVDLGHVRFRFLASGEDFVFSRDAKDASRNNLTTGREWWVALDLEQVA